MMKRIILPFEINPIFTVYQTKAYELGIIQANYGDIRPWIYNKNINVQYLKNKKRFTFVYYDLWLTDEGMNTCQKLRLQQNILNSENLNIFSLVNEMLENGYYVYFRCNEFYIPHKYAYNKRDFDHDGFIYGYVDNERLYYSAGYTENQKYEAFTFTYDEFIQGVTNLKSGQLHFDFIKPTQMLKNELNLKDICDDLFDYIHSINIRPNVAENKIFGMDCLRFFVAYIGEIRESGREIDIRHCRLFAELKALMLERIEYLYQNKYIQNELHVKDYADLYQKSRMIHNLCLKYNLTKKQMVLDKIVSMQNESIEKEHTVLLDILNELYVFLGNKNNLRIGGIE